MFGMELSELYAFLLQVGLAVSGAAALWGVVFSTKARMSDSDVTHIIYHWIAQRLKYLLYASGLLSLIAWGLISNWIATHAHAHEGIRLVPTFSERIAAIELISPIMIIWITLLILTALFHLSNHALFHRYLPMLFVIHFTFVVVLISFASAWTGEISNEKVFFVLHNFHSILTVGTVIVLDYLFLSAKSSHVLQRHVIPLFPWISKVIWIGLGIDFLSVALVFDDALAYTSTFFFAQTVVGILIINGVMLAGPITRRMLDSLHHGLESMQRRWVLIADAAGAISITSWVAITFVDFFEGITLSYWQLLGIYGAVLVIGFSGHVIWQWLDREAPLLPHEE